MFGSNFYHQTIRRYIITFGNMFNDIMIRRLNQSGVVIQSLAVPIAYGPKEKWLARSLQDPNLNQQVAISLPRLSFEITSTAYDANRHLPSTLRNVNVYSDKNKLYYQYTPVPYDFNINLYAMVSNADDGAQIMEQIVPYFAPEWTNSVILFPANNIDITMDVPTILNSVEIEDTYEGNFDTRRAIVYTFGFTLKGFLYGPIRHQGVIKRSQIDFGIVASNTGNRITLSDAAHTGRSSRIVVVPGLLANGSPTTNSAASIPYNQIKAEDDYGFASNTFFYLDGKKYNPKTGNDEPLK
jgi:hypothetical protein